MAAVYLDHNATTPLEPTVLEAMMPFLTDRYGNPSSRHAWGRQARRALDKAREQVAAAVGAHPTEVIFTSGGSEANNLFLKGAASATRPGLIAHSAIEHPSVWRAAAALGRQGWRVRQISVDGEGRVLKEDFLAMLGEQPTLISLMAANNETGTIQEVETLALLAHESGAWFHTDAVQALGKLPLDFRRLNAAGVHAMSLSAHKIGGPKGAGALIVDKCVELLPLIDGGGQERGLRSGTENVPALVGFGAACELASVRLKETAQRLARLREQLEAGLAALGATIFAQQALRLPNTSFFTFAGIDGETLVERLARRGFALGSGAACSSAQTQASHVLLAMGVAPALARGAVRVSLGAHQAEADIAEFLQALAETLSHLRAMTAMAA
ncbi:MAG: cysteine desulfurase [Rhodocyclaceae bacterium]|nr:cysteine desulfurase [Rhodocyclaceae bacterium]